MLNKCVFVSRIPSPSLQSCAIQLLYYLVKALSKWSNFTLICFPQVKEKDPITHNSLYKNRPNRMSS